MYLCGMEWTEVLKIDSSIIIDFRWEISRSEWKVNTWKPLEKNFRDYTYQCLLYAPFIIICAYIYLGN